MDVLPFVLLGRRVALQPDIGASASELTFGTTVRIPGQILYDPGDLPEGPRLKELLQQVKTSTAERIHQTSRHNPPEPAFKSIPENITHVYTKQHQTKGLQAPYEGPFLIDSRPSRSTLKLVVGTYKDGSPRHEIRHLNDVKLAHPDSMAAPASRPALGRPSAQAGVQRQTELNPTETVPPSQNRLSSDPKPTVNKSKQPVDASPVANSSDSNHATSSQVQREPALNVGIGGFNEELSGPPPVPAFTTGRPVRATRNQSPKYVDAIWVASNQELADIQASINGNK